MSFQTLTSLDLIGILICVLSGIIGFKRGAINTLISFGGFIASFVIAWFFSPLLADWLIQSGMLNNLFTTINIDAISQSLMDLGAQQSGLTNALLGEAAMSSGQSILDQGITVITEVIKHGIANSISFGILVMGVSVLCWLLQAIFLGISKLPVIGILNRLAGAIIGVVLGAAIIAVMLWVFSVINLTTGGVSKLPTVEASSLLTTWMPIGLNVIGIQ
ncbi:CvpA family protein [Acetobacterium wieringae]|uniref:Colicin V production protein n=1 Tax=Acetobacterium wieringae TaxID=52694 RepID=A0A1F2PJZ4_9FIRM|nr:CvpA family protein [Acetobacterium wieringae]OFV71214.1 colicin V production protein [Acetobacterium wieringae]